MFSKIYVAKVKETGKIIFLPSLPSWGRYKIIAKIHKPFNPYYLELVSRYYAKQEGPALPWVYAERERLRRLRRVT